MTKPAPVTPGAFFAANSNEFRDFASPGPSKGLSPEYNFSAAALLAPRPGVTGCFLPKIRMNFAILRAPGRSRGLTPNTIIFRAAALLAPVTGFADNSNEFRDFASPGHSRG